MMRTLAFLLFAAVAADEIETSDLVKPVRIVQQSGCLLDSAEIINDAVDAAMYMWASVARCEKGSSETKCVVAISSTVQSVNAMVLILVKGLQTCGDITTENEECGIAAAKLTKRAAGLTKQSAGIVDHCESAPPAPAPVAPPPPPAAPAPAAPCTTVAPGGRRLDTGIPYEPHHEPIECAINIKDASVNLFKAVKAIMQNSRDCNEETQEGKPMRCASNALKIIGAFSGIGQYLAGAVAHCEPNKALVPGSECAQSSIGFVEQLNDIAEAGMELARKCNVDDIPPPKVPVSTVPPTGMDLVEEQEAKEAAMPTPGRLYSKQSVFSQNAGSNTNVILTAFLPVTAIVGFVGGRMYAVRRSGMDQAREIMSDGEVDIE